MDGEQPSSDGGESGAEPATEVKPEGLKTRRECAIFSGKVFAAVMAAALLPPVAWALIPDGNGELDMEALRLALSVMVMAVPPAFFFGVLDGFEMYRLTVGSKPWQPWGWWVWLLLVLCVCGWWALILYLLHWQRERLIMQRKPGGWWLPCFLAVMIGGLQLASMLLLSSALKGAGHVHRELTIPAAIGAIGSLLLGDSLVIHTIARWRNEGRLAPPESHKFQYSLGTLVLFVWGFGAWMTAVVLMFR